MHHYRKPVSYLNNTFNFKLTTHSQFKYTRKTHYIAYIFVKVNTHFLTSPAGVESPVVRQTFESLMRYEPLMELIERTIGTQVNQHHL